MHKNPGCLFIATNDDATFPTKSGSRATIPGCGVFVSAMLRNQLSLKKNLGGLMRNIFKLILVCVGVGVTVGVEAYGQEARKVTYSELLGFQKAPNCRQAAQDFKKAEKRFDRIMKDVFNPALKSALSDVADPFFGEANIERGKLVEVLQWVEKDIVEMREYHDKLVVRQQRLQARERLTDATRIEFYSSALSFLNADDCGMIFKTIEQSEKKMDQIEILIAIAKQDHLARELLALVGKRPKMDLSKPELQALEVLTVSDREKIVDYLQAKDISFNGKRLEVYHQVIDPHERMRSQISLEEALRAFEPGMSLPRDAR